MKRNQILSLLTVLLAGTFLFSSCNGEKDIRFVVPYTISGFTLQQQACCSEKIFNEQVVTQALEDSLGQYGASLTDITKVQLNKLVITITSSGDSFDGVSYLQSYLKADGLDSVQVAFLSAVPQTGLTSVELESSYANLADHLTSPEFSFEIKGYNPVVYGPVDFAVTFEVEVLATIKN